MRKTLIIATREYMTAIRSKAFLVTLILMPVFMGGSLIAYMLLKDNVDTKDRRVAVIDHSGVVTEALVAETEARNKTEIFDEDDDQKQVKPKYLIEAITPNLSDPDAQLLTLSDKVRAQEYHAILEIGSEAALPDGDSTNSKVTYYAENASMDDVRRWLGWPVNRQLRVKRMEAQGMDYETVAGLIEYISLEGMGLLSETASGEIMQAEKSSEGRSFGVPAAIMMLMFMIIMIGAVPLGQAIVEEKSQRIAEVLIGSVRPFDLMLGKLIGSVAISLTTVAIYILGAVFAMNRMGIADFVPYDLLPWMVAFQVLAVFMFGSIFVGIGAACNDAKEIQSLQMPVMMLVMVPMFVWMFVLKEPTSTFATVLSLVPTCTPILMLIRQASPITIPAWQPWAGLGIVILTTIFTVWAAGRIFRVGLLMQGKAPNLAGLARWVVKG
jgi:ABC-2 type transport system permease protein